MTVINPSATIVEIENESVMAAETATEIESGEIAAGTRFARRQMEIGMERPQVITAVQMEVQRVGAEAEVEMMTADTHVATEIALTRPAAEMEIITEEVAELAHVLGALIEIRGAHAESAASEMMRIRDRGKTVAKKMSRAEQVEVQSARVHLH